MPFVGYRGNAEFETRSAQELAENHILYGFDDATALRAHGKSLYLVKTIEDIINEDFDIQVLMSLSDNQFDKLFELLQNMYNKQQKSLEIRITSTVYCYIKFNGDEMEIHKFDGQMSIGTATVNINNCASEINDLLLEARASNNGINRALLKKYSGINADNLSGYADLNVYYPRFLKELMKTIHPSIVSLYANMVEYNLCNQNACITSPGKLIELAETFNNTNSTYGMCEAYYKILMKDAENNAGIGQRVLRHPYSSKASDIINVANSILSDAEKYKHLLGYDNFSSFKQTICEQLSLKLKMCFDAINNGEYGELSDLKLFMTDMDFNFNFPPEIPKEIIELFKKNLYENNHYFVSIARVEELKKAGKSNGLQLTPPIINIIQPNDLTFCQAIESLISDAFDGKFNNNYSGIAFKYSDISFELTQENLDYLRTYGVLKIQLSTSTNSIAPVELTFEPKNGVKISEMPGNVKVELFNQLSKFHRVYHGNVIFMPEFMEQMSDFYKIKLDKFE